MVHDKILQSGLVVDGEEYYLLLDWKDKNMDSYLLFMEIHSPKSITGSINHIYSLDLYNKLIKHAGI